MEDHTKGAAFLLKWHIQGWWVGPQLIDDTYSNNVSITVACWVDFNTWRWFACVQASHFRFRAARENAQTIHARERRSELRERRRKRAARENAQASHERERVSQSRERMHKRDTRENTEASHEKERASNPRERTSELRERTRKRATERARAREPREGTRKHIPQTKGFLAGYHVV